MVGRLRETFLLGPPLSSVSTDPVPGDEDTDGSVHSVRSLSSWGCGLGAWLLSAGSASALQ